MKTNRLKIAFCYDLSVLGAKGIDRTLSSCDAVVFPELVDGGYAKLRSHPEPQRPDSLLVQQFRRFSRALSSVCIAGSLHLQKPHRLPANTTLVFRSGKLISEYSKIHLFKPAGDHKHFAPGTRVSLFNAGPRAQRIKAGVIICYDLRFPELTRCLAEQGMKILFVPSRWPRIRDDAWRTLLKARAIENQIFVLGCNARGNEGGFSYAFDPMGKQIFTNRGRGSVKIQVCVLRLERLTNAKRSHDNLREARLLNNLRHVMRHPSKNSNDHRRQKRFF